jgi:hypothetical protein
VNLLRTSINGAGKYSRHQPEKTILYEVIQRNWETFQTQAEENGKTIAFYIKKEFQAYLQCGMLAFGLLRLKCSDCKHKNIVAVSCKKRGFCPSCCAKRMSESGIFMSEEVFPDVPVRQWVISVPFPLRYWMASRPALMTKILAIITRAINGYYQQKAKKSGILIGGKTGSYTVIQRFSSILALNVHFHCLWMDGVHVKNAKELKGRAIFKNLPPPNNKEVLEVLTIIRNRVVRYLIKKEYLKNETDLPDEDAFAQEELLLAEVMSASVQSKIALGERAGQKVRKVGSFGAPNERAQLTGLRCTALAGFSLHANVCVDAGKKHKLQKLCRYLMRPPLSLERLYRTTEGEIGYRLKKAWSDGTQAIILSELELIEKLIAIIPPPKTHSVRFFGTLAPNSSWRAQIVPPKPPEKEQTGFPSSRKMKWAELLKRTFQIDLENCECGGKLKFIAVIVKRSQVQTILDHLDIPSEPPRFHPPRYPPY